MFFKTDRDKSSKYRSDNNGFNCVKPKGIPLAIEVKIGKDKLTKDQKRYAHDFAQAGGVFIVARSFTEFYNEFNERFSI